MSKPTSQYRPARVLIDSSAMQYNLHRVRELCPMARVMAVVKADGYGHGMELAVDALREADEFAVNSLDDVLRLRRHGVDKPLCVLSAVLDAEQIMQMAELDARPLIFDHAQVKILADITPSLELPVWLKVDTGMGRLGFLPIDLPAVLAQLQQAPVVGKIGLMSHLANADVPDHAGNQRQFDQFDVLADAADFDQLSILNSGGITAFPQHAHQVVRPGVMLYGISPLSEVPATELDLRPAMTFKSELVSVRQLPAGSTIGYGDTYTLTRDSTIGVVACGYGDGYPRHAANGTPVMVNGVQVPLVGRVSMDMLSVDLGDVPARVGDQAVLWGEGNPIEQVAKSAGTIAYELVCGILPRVQRVSV